MEIKGKNALVTGSAKRIGKAIAVNLAKEGANVIVHYRSSKEEALKVKQEIESFGVKCALVKADLENLEEVFFLAFESLRIFGSIDILVNNASIYYPTPLEELKEEDIDRFYNVHVKAPLFLSKELGLSMFKNKNGRIINIADYSAIKPYPNYIAYNISKGAMLTLTRNLAKELAPYVLVNAVLPGPIVPPEDLEDKNIPLKKTVLKKWGREVEIWKAVKFLIESDFTTGVFLPVEGGRLIY
ncbi:MAG: SDR family NAD(P)-dependent oxidoreductase [Aquificae bacterium]|nr:SDR family NAD(P)-dependent oxidoreductase [Aquificota bacterium]